MKILALVTARSGSKRFPGKNLALLNGRPLVTWAHYIIDSLKATTRGMEITSYLSTDSQEIADAWPADDRPKHLRPANLALDCTLSISVVHYEMNHHDVDAVLLLQPTSPLVICDDLAHLVSAASRCGSAIGVTENKHASWQCRMTDDGSMASMGIKGRVFVPMGVYCATVPFLRNHGELFVSGATVGIEIPSERSIDIDTRLDLDIAQTIINRKEYASCH